MPMTSSTYIRSNNSSRILGLIDQYFNDYNLQLVEERIANRKGKYLNSPKTYTNLTEYDES